jgi:hypothetical protein
LKIYERDNDNEIDKLGEDNNAHGTLMTVTSFLQDLRDSLTRSHLNLEETMTKTMDMKSDRRGPPGSSFYGSELGGATISFEEDLDYTYVSDLHC